MNPCKPAHRCYPTGSGRSRGLPRQRVLPGGLRARVRRRLRHDFGSRAHGLRGTRHRLGTEPLPRAVL